MLDFPINCGAVLWQYLAFVMMLSVQSADLSTQHDAIKNCFINIFKTNGKFLNKKILSSYAVCLQILRNFIGNVFV